MRKRKRRMGKRKVGMRVGDMRLRVTEEVRIKDRGRRKTEEKVRMGVREEVRMRVKMGGG